MFLREKIDNLVGAVYSNQTDSFKKFSSIKLFIRE